MRSLLSIPTKQQQALVFPAVLIAFILNIFLLVYSLIAGLNLFENQISLATALLKSAYLLIFYIHFIPLLERYPERDWVILAVNTIVAVFIEFIGHLLPAGYSFTCILLMTAISSLIFGRLYAYIFLACASTAHIVTLGLNDQNIINSVFLDLFFLPLLGIATTETLLKLQSSLQFEINRQQIINKVSRSLSSSLEIHQVITMVTTAVQSALDADTYYFGLIEEDTVHLELFYDDGEFFPSMNVPIEGTLAGRVIQTRQPLLICDLPEERKKLGIDYKLVGKNKVSLSWLGVPLISGKEVLGIIAVASYQKSAFTTRADQTFFGKVFGKLMGKNFALAHRFISAQRCSPRRFDRYRPHYGSIQLPGCREFAVHPLRRAVDARFQPPAPHPKPPPGALWISVRRRN